MIEVWKKRFIEKAKGLNLFGYQRQADFNLG